MTDANDHAAARRVSLTDGSGTTAAMPGLDGTRVDTDPSLAELLKGKRVAIVHEWVAAYAGSEQVFEALAQMVPTADLFALSVEPGVELSVGGRPIRTTVLNNSLLRRRRHLSLPLMPLAWWALGRGNYDVVITSHHAFAHCNRLTRQGGIHLSYVHSPARYIWTPGIDDRGSSAFLTPARALLKWIDRRATYKVNGFMANSTAVAARIWSAWGRQSEVVFPPVRTELFRGSESDPRTRDYVLGFSRWIPYKNLHKVIEAGDRAGLPVKIAGRGPDRSAIDAAAARASVAVEIIESPTDDQLASLYRNAKVLVFPAIEDFGIVPVEAQAAGTPVIGVQDGGIRDTVKDGISGLIVASADPDLLATAIGQVSVIESTSCVEMPSDFRDPSSIVQ